MERILKHPSALWRTCGVTSKEFDRIVARFQLVYDSEQYEYTVLGRSRERAGPGGRHNALVSAKHRVLFVMLYHHLYPTQKALGGLFGMSQQWASLWIKYLTPMVEEAKGAAFPKIACMPQRLDELIVREPLVLLATDAWTSSRGFTGPRKKSGPRPKASRQLEAWIGGPKMGPLSTRHGFLATSSHGENACRAQAAPQHSPCMKDAPTPTRSGDLCAAWIAGGLFVAWTIFCMARGMPWSHPDDTFFLGAGIDLARTGQLVNHGIDTWLAAFGTDRFYVQLPFGPYALAAWIKMFGVHAIGFTVMQWTWYAVGVWGLTRMLGRGGLPWGMRWLLAIIHLRLVLVTGFRPEAQALGLTFAGLALLETGSPAWRRCLSLVLMGAGALTYPVVVGFTPLGVALMWLDRRDETPSWWALARAWMGPAAVAAVVLGGGFGLMIHGDLPEFLRVFNAHRHARTTTGQPLREYLSAILNYREAALTLPTQALLIVAAGYVALRWRRLERGVRWLVVACAVSAPVCVALYAVRAAAWITLPAFIAACAVASAENLRRARWSIVLGLGGLYLWSQAISLVDVFGRQTVSTWTWDAARVAWAATGKAPVADSTSARYVFDFRLPPGGRLLEYSHMPTDQTSWTLADKAANEVWVISANSLTQYFDPKTKSNFHPARLNLGKQEFHSLLLCPDEPMIIP